MERQIINITDEQVKNLVNEMAILITKLKKEQGIECIYLTSYKDKQTVKDNVVELTVVTRENTDKMSKDFCKYNEMHQKDTSIDEFGIKISVVFDGTRNYTKLPLNPSEVIRGNNLVNSTILYDRDGEYLIIKQEAQKHLNMLNSGIFKYTNLIEINQPVDELIKKELEEKSTKEFIKY